jgi:hypothetical protein
MENINDKEETKALSQIAVMPRCYSCKHWKQTTFYDYEGAENDGDCNEIGTEIIIELKTGLSGGYVDNIETKSTFGCVLHNEA